MLVGARFMRIVRMQPCLVDSRCQPGDSQSRRSATCEPDESLSYGNISLVTDATVHGRVMWWKDLLSQ